MLPYWLLFSTGAVLALTSWWRHSGFAARVITVAIILSLTLFVGYRFETGADWGAYEFIFLDINRMNLGDALTYIEPAYSFINWVVGLFGGNLWHVNLLCAAFFSWALVRFCQTLPLPGVAFLAAIPTLIIVVAMSYTRQSCAVACIMLAMRAYDGSFNWRWLVWLSLGATFHNSTILMFPVFILAASKNRVVSLAMGAVVIAALLSFFILDNAQGLIARYLEGDVQSSGTIPRILLATIPALLFFLVKNRRERIGGRYALLRNMAYASLLLIPMVFLVNSTTVVDRIGVLLLPFQLYFYSLAPLSFARNRIAQTAIVAAIVAVNGVTLAVWLSFSDYSNYWVPYRNVIFEDYL